MVRGGKAGKAKTARKSTGGQSPVPRPPRRRRETARKSTGGLAPRMQLSRSTNNYEDSSEEEASSGHHLFVSRLINPTEPSQQEGTPPRGNNLLIRSIRPVIASSALPNTGGDANGVALTSTKATPRNQATGLPVQVYDPWTGTEPPREQAGTGLNAAAVETAVGALQTSTTFQSHQNNPPKTERISIDDVTNGSHEAVAADSSTSSSAANAPTCEPSSTHTTAEFVLPPAVPGHSRWATSQDNPNTTNTDTDSQQTPSSLPAPRRKKKHFTPLPFSESSAKRIRTNSGSEENPVVITEAENNNNSLTLNGSKFDTKKVKQAFAHFQSIRQLLVDSRACSHMNGFVHLSAVEQMLIKCYQYSKKANNSVDTAPVIVLDDSSDVNTTVNNNLLINPLSLPTQTDVNVLDLSNVANMTSGSPPSALHLDSNRSSSADINHNSNSSTGSTASLTTRTGNSTGVAKKRAAIVSLPNTAASTTEIGSSATPGSLRHPAIFIVKSEFSSTAQTGSSSARSSTTTLNHIDEAINTVVGAGSSSPPLRGGGPASGARDDDNARTPNISHTNADLLAQMSDAQKETLNALVCMGFGGEEEAAFNQLLNVVRTNNGNLGACLDKLTH